MKSPLIITLLVVFVATPLVVIGMFYLCESFPVAENMRVRQKDYIEDQRREAEKRREWLEAKREEEKRIREKKAEEEKRIREAKEAEEKRAREEERRKKEENEAVERRRKEAAQKEEEERRLVRESFRNIRRMQEEKAKEEERRKMKEDFANYRRKKEEEANGIFTINVHIAPESSHLVGGVFPNYAEFKLYGDGVVLRTENSKSTVVDFKNVKVKKGT